MNIIIENLGNKKLRIHVNNNFQDYQFDTAAQAALFLSKSKTAMRKKGYAIKTKGFGND